MKFLPSLAFAVAAALTLATVTSAGGSCGKTNVEMKLDSYVTNYKAKRMVKRQKLNVIGGALSHPHSHPWNVHLRTAMDFCSGMLIRAGNKDETDMVLTAAHCLGDEVKCPTDLVAVAGSHNTTAKEKGEQERKVVKCAAHGKYQVITVDGGKKALFNDIALLKLESPVKFSDTIQPVCLPSEDQMVADARTGLVSGWGATNASATFLGSEVLMEVAVAVKNIYDCQKYYTEKRVKPQHHFCAGDEAAAAKPDGQNRDSCKGDSGGPLIFKTEKGITLFGIVSFGDGCGKLGAYGVYTKVPAYAKWIEAKVKEMTSVED